ncbi:uncharacterized protein EI97DRAFT_227213 [Westerdykella ornata]|uniref:Uncharacterized protein n=1 Tax=Westerdykella ornata TaxID=318751 RepID=A0A6A6JVK0_WESOR|nr:uncharacterized protein EI97DRAFT_227213 [Westerdykella ornata]KAF2279079.1 hypothetical protein EI97DRAFT_227213 [Westerdykella ornata]
MGIQDLYWNESKRYGDAIPHDGPPLTGPKPDLTYAFPILDTTKITAPYVSDPKVNDFSLEVLGELRTNKKVELRSAPTTKLHSSQTKKNLQLGNADLLCFPWAIVEAKKNEPNMKDHRAAGEFCYCQAANASAAALKLREDLMELAKDCPNTHDGLAIFAFTCVGPTVKLWVTHKIKSKAETITLMRCIWATSLELTWGAMALRMVIENMQEWVYHRVTPEIWRWIRMVRAAHPPQPCIPPGAVLPSQTRRAASCEPTRERKHATSPSPKTHAVETRRKSSPGSSHRQGHIHSLPIRTRKDSFGKNHSNKEEKRDSEGREDEREEEGDSSDATYEPSSTGEDDITEEDEEDFTDSTVESDNSEEEEEGYTAESEYSEDEAEKREDTQGQRSSSHQQRPDKAGSLGKNGRAKEYRSDEDHTEGRYRPKSDKSKGKDTPSPNRRRRSSHGSPSPSGWKSKFPEWKAYPRSLQVLLADFWEKNESNCEVALDILKRFFSFSWRHDDDFLLALSQLHDLSLVNKSRFEELVKLSSRVDQFEFQEELERVLELAVWEQEWDPDASIPIVL